MKRWGISQAEEGPLASRTLQQSRPGTPGAAGRECGSGPCAGVPVFLQRPFTRDPVDVGRRPLPVQTAAGEIVAEWQELYDQTKNPSTARRPGRSRERRPELSKRCCKQIIEIGT